MKASIKRYCSLFMIILVVVTTLSANVVTVNAAETDNRKVRIGCSVTTGYHEYDESGNVNGYGYDYEDILAQYANWDVEYVEGSWSELNQKLENGEIDLLGFLVKTPEREKVFEFADSPSGISKSCLVTRVDNEKYSYEEFDAFDGMTVGYQQNNANMRKVQEWGNAHGFSVNAIEYTSVKDAYAAMEDGTVDAVLATNFNTLDGYKVIARMLPEDFYYAVTKGNQSLLNELNAAVDEILLYYPDLTDTLYQNYYDERNGSQVAFTKEEKEYLDTHPVVSVFPGSREAPYECYNESSGSYDGIIPDVLEEISAISGIIFQYEKTDDRWAYKDSKIQGNKLTCFTNDFSWAEKNEVVLTQPFVDSSISVITREANKEINTIASVSDRYIDYNVKLLYPDCTIQYYDTVEDCFWAVLNGQCDATYVNSIVADYFFTIGRYSILHESICEDFTQDICFASTKDSDVLLNSVLSKSLLMLSTERVGTIVKTNVNESRNIGLVDLVYTNPQQLTFVVVMVAVLFVLAVLFAIKTRKAYQIIKEISDKDMVTNIYNRSAFEQRLHKKHWRTVEQVSCIYMDANGLHEINNEKGHQAGDLLLQEIADTLRMVFAGKDVFRIGGDEFLIVCIGVDEDGVKVKIDEMTKQLEKNQISVSYGMKYADRVTNNQEMQMLVQAADELMLENKKNYYKEKGRNAR